MIRVATLLHEQLLEHAENVLRSVAQRKTQADLRRVVSTAYYSVFHLVCMDAANLFSGALLNRRNAPASDLKAYAHVYRSLDHKQLRKVCDAVRAKKLDPRITEMLPTGEFIAQVRDFAAITIELYEARLRADYDPIARFDAADASAKVASARKAFSLYKTIQNPGGPAVDRSVFLKLLMFSRRP